MRLNFSESTRRKPTTARVTRHIQAGSETNTDVASSVSHRMSDSPRVRNEVSSKSWGEVKMATYADLIISIVRIFISKFPNRVKKT